MNKKTRASLLALTIIVSQQLHAEPAQELMEQPKTSYFTWKNAGIAAALAGTATAAYIYQDALIDLLSAKSPRALIATEEEKLAIQKEFLALPQAEQDAITAELQKVSGQDGVNQSDSTMRILPVDGESLNEAIAVSDSNSEQSTLQYLWDQGNSAISYMSDAFTGKQPEATQEEVKNDTTQEAESIL